MILGRPHTMKISIPFEAQLAWRHLRGASSGDGNRFIGFISRMSMLGIALGVAALIVLLSVVNGFQVEVRDRMLGLVPHITLVPRDGSDWATLAAAVQADPAVSATAPAVQGQALLGRADAMRGAVLRGIDPAREAAVSPVVAQLAPALLSTLQPGSRQALLGQALAMELNVKTGDLVVVVRPSLQPGGAPRLTPLTVAGTFAAGHFELDNTLVLLHWQDAAELLGLPGINTVQAQLTDALAAPAVAAALRGKLGDGVAVRDWTQVNRVWFESVALQRRMLALILTLIVAVAAFNLVSTLVMTVTDKRAEIAILRTLGASPSSIMGVFMLQGLLAGLVGTLGGVVLGLGIALNLDQLVPALERLLGTRLLAPSIYIIDHMPSLPRASDVVPVALVSLLLSLLATLYPSWRASQLRPAEALRGE